MKTELKIAMVLGVVIVVSVGIISTIFASLDSEFESKSIDENNIEPTIEIDKSKFKRAPDLVGIAYYLNTTPETLAEEIKGKVVLYDIWTYSCINCIRTLPYITAWNDKYSDEGLLIIGIHSPEFEFEKIQENVELAISKHGITYPVVMDNDWETWKAFENRYWPRKYIADHEGFIRYDHIGEGAYQETEKIIQQLLKERSSSLGLQIADAESLVDIEEFEHTSFRTPELYFGYNLAQGRNQLGSSEGFNQNKIITYSEPDNLDLHKFYLVGIWNNLKDSMRLESDSGSIKVLYHAKEVNIVTSNSADLEIFLDGVPLDSKYSGDDIEKGNKITVSEPDLYNIIKSEKSATHELEIKINQKGFEIYTFTFG
ncbi:MAG: redoxin domain-containing protein [Nitrosopumilus sp.]|nr:redoxin domain-containing protein [Nitrosopumilus sp.]MDH3385035.1 redoxin domain-containing protein [Nitrosopumilus sp.]